MPDFYVPVLPGRSTLSSEQSEWGVTGNEYIEGGEMAEIDLYTVPEGYEVQVAFILMSCTKAGIHFGNLLKNSVDMMPWNFNILSVIPLMGGGEFLFVEDDDMDLEITNEIDEGATFYYTLKGTISEV